MKNKRNAFLILTILMTVTYCSRAQGINIPDWKVLSEENKTPELTDTVFLGKPCIKLDGALKSAIWNQKLNIRNFRMDLDIAGAVMSGIGFHASNEQNYQFIYFRPGYGGTEEAIQYIPIYNGALSWVMYGKYQDTAVIKPSEWFHATIEVRGNNLKVFTNHNKKPDMDITMLNTSASTGSILLRTLFGPTYFANVMTRELPDYITDWEISEQLPVSTAFDYSQVKKVKSWKKINESGDDYVNLCRYFDNPNGVLFARHIIHCDSDQMKSLNFDFAGKMHILLNGKEVFFYDKFKLDRLVDGLNKIRLNLVKGDNELVFLTEGDSYIFGNGKGYNSLGRLQDQNWGFISSLSKM
jgi:hypothetical protein